MNAQLASFTQLRHDSLLYPKQSYTRRTKCEYAAGFVDPYPQFYEIMGQLATRLAKIIQNLSSPAANSALRYRGEPHFTAFAETMKTLAEIAGCQTDKQPLSDEQTDFVKTIMEERFKSGAIRYAGWYPKLFYAEREDSGKRDVFVVDVHTDVPSAERNDPGGVLHLGTGDVHFGFFVVDNVLYSGPVFSSYEFVTGINKRLTDDEFAVQVDFRATNGRAMAAVQLLSGGDFGRFNTNGAIPVGGKILVVEERLAQDFAGLQRTTTLTRGAFNCEDVEKCGNMLDELYHQSLVVTNFPLRAT